jgi:hypothetical protein
LYIVTFIDILPLYGINMDVLNLFANSIFSDFSNFLFAFFFYKSNFKFILHCLVYSTNLDKCHF